MLTKSKIALAVATILAAAFASSAKGGGPPTVDIERTCRESATALGSGNAKEAVDVCVMDEQAARDELVKDWGKYPALAKAQCVQTKEYLPGYVEWLACVEMTRDVTQLRKQAVASTPRSANASLRSARHRAASETRDCPRVQMRDDGSINYIINC
jgi:hypothetical protein